MNRIICSGEYDPAYNLALEEELFRTPKDGIWLYLWQNCDAVVIGRNQNAFTECDIDYIKEKQILLVRRLSGGGAVYHDQGNLNYTFLFPSGAVEQERLHEVLYRALGSFEIDCTFSGRNDMLVAGKKISGQAYYEEDGLVNLHGTILIDVDLERMEKVLKPSALKLTAKGITSVKSRVQNLNMVCKEITVETMKQALCAEFQKQFGTVSEVDVIKQSDRIPSNWKKYRDDQWNYGACPKYSAEVEVRAESGTYQLCVNVVHGAVTDVKVYSDSLQLSLCQRLEKELGGRLAGQLFDADRIRQMVIRETESYYASDCTRRDKYGYL